MSETQETRLKRMTMRSWRRGTKEMDLILGEPLSSERGSKTTATSGAEKSTRPSRLSATVFIVKPLMGLPDRDERDSSAPSCCLAAFPSSETAKPAPMSPFETRTRAPAAASESRMDRTRNAFQHFVKG